MILKRIVLPAIAVIAILVSMIVPAFAASHELPTETPIYTYVSPILDFYFDSGIKISVEAPARASVGSDPVISTIDDYTYYFSANKYNDADFYEFDFAFPVSVTMPEVHFRFPILVIKNNEKELTQFLTFVGSNKLGYKYRFDCSYVDADGHVQTESFSGNGHGLTEYGVQGFNRLGYALRDRGCAEDSYIVISNYEATFEADPMSNNFTYRMPCTWNTGLLTDIDDFLHDNGILYGDQIIYKSEFNFDTLVDFLISGVGSFLETPFLGGFSFGDFFGILFSIAVVFIFVKMF